VHRANSGPQPRPSRPHSRLCLIGHKWPGQPRLHRKWPRSVCDTSAVSVCAGTVAKHRARAVAWPPVATRPARRGAKAGKSTDGARPSCWARWDAVELTRATQHRGGGGSVGRGDVCWGWRCVVSGGSDDSYGRRRRWGR
jgi:hypothetical protein